MNHYLRKLKLVLPAFIAVTFGTVIGLALLKWLFALKFSIVDIPEKAWEFWIPMTLPCATIFIWLRPRFKMLRFKADQDGSRAFLYIISWGTMAAMLFVSQVYLRTATGSLKILSSIDDIENTGPARYYKLPKFSVAPYYGGTYATSNKSGKFGEDLHFTIYFVAPIFDNTSGQLTRVPNTWYGVQFTKRINNWTSKLEKEKRYGIFYNECLEKINTYNFHSLDYFERIPGSEDYDNYLKAIQSRVHEPTVKNFIILKPVQGKYEERKGNKLAWIFVSFGAGLGLLALALIRPAYEKIEG